MIPSCKHFKLIDDKGTRKIYGMTIKKGVTVNLSWNSNWPKCPACIIEQREKDIADLVRRMHKWLKWADDYLSDLEFTAPILEATEFNDVINEADWWLKENTKKPAKEGK